MTKNQICELFPIGPDIPDHRHCDPISAISGGIGLVGNVVSGIMGKSAATKAGQMQQQAAQNAASGVTASVGQANAGIGTATTNAQQLATAGGQQVVNTAANAASGATAAAGQANSILDPYSQAGQAAAGTLQTGLAAGGDFNKSFNAADLQMDPGYQFRLQQAALASTRSAAARGDAVSGAALTDLNNQIQGVASNEVGNAFQRYETDTTNRYNRLFGQEGVGLQAGTTQGGNLTNAAQYGGNITTGAANSNLGAQEYAGSAGLQGATQMGQNAITGATTAGNFLTGGANGAAASTLAGSNALSAGLTGGASAVSGALTLSQLLKNPALGSGYGPNAPPPNAAGYYSGSTVNPNGSITVRR